jgi:membrane fusion protein (multidrug efflux system)
MTARNLSLLTLAFGLSGLSCQRDSATARLPASPPVSSQPAPVAKAPEPAPAATPTEATGAAKDNSPFLSGTTEAHRRSILTPKVSSTVTRVHVREGDVVKAGQPLVTLDTRDFVLRAQQAAAARDGAKVQVDAAKIDWDRIKGLLADKAVPQAQFDGIDARYKGALAGLRSAETTVAIAQKALRDSVVRAPFDGIIVKRMVNEGEYASLMPATQLVSIEEINPIDLRIQVPANDMGTVKAGVSVHVRLPATGQQMDLRLTRVVAASDPKTRTFSAIVEIPNPDHTLRSGLYAEVTIKPGAAEAAPAAPTKTKKRARASKD